MKLHFEYFGRSCVCNFLLAFIYSRALALYYKRNVTVSSTAHPWVSFQGTHSMITETGLWTQQPFESLFNWLLLTWNQFGRVLELGTLMYKCQCLSNTTQTRQLMTGFYTWAWVPPTHTNTHGVGKENGHLIVEQSRLRAKWDFYSVLLLNHFCLQPLLVSIRFSLLSIFFLIPFRKASEWS